ncbi:MAG: ROK family protein [Thermoplasmata archaeon YP2-bin.285]|uniref:ROK family protein n=2 Tax=Candidatus Sysuiplasma superficiale TaxID=2823368 RepID=A0A8J8CEJ5_9ARCH|nr:ROK family protein [Candidatus Sysuiplasma superficiale]
MAMTATPVLAVDAGGTWMRSAVVSGGRLFGAMKRDSPNFIRNRLPLEDLQEAFLDEIRTTVLHYRERHFRFSSIAIAFPGPVRGGSVYGAPTLWGPMNSPYPLIRRLRGRLGGTGIRQIAVINDMTAMGWRYVSRRMKDFCIITVSSGIGSKIFWNGEAMLGSSAMGGEIGHWFCGDRYGNLVCDCGERGHLGAVSSGRGIAKLAASMLQSGGGEASAPEEQIESLDVIEGVLRGDRFWNNVLEESVKPLASAIRLIALSTGLSLFIVVGGFASSLGRAYTKALSNAVLDDKFMRTFNYSGRGIRIVIGESSDYQALRGLWNYLNSGNAEVYRLS